MSLSSHIKHAKYYISLPVSLSFLSTGKRRDIEVRITPSESISISTDVNCLPLSRSAAASVKPPPSKLSLIREVEMSGWCTTVSTYQGHTYVGLDNGEISRIGLDSKVGSFAKLNNTIYYGMAMNEGLLYTTSGIGPQVLSVHNLNTGKLVRSWNHSETSHLRSSNLAVIGGDKVVIADRSNKRLSLYTLTGQIIRQIPCQQLAGGYVSLCAAENDSVIVSDYRAKRLYRISITTGQVLWESTHIERPPQGVTCYNNQYVLVASHLVKIQILDVNTGEYTTMKLESYFEYSDKETHLIYINGVFKCLHVPLIDNTE